jgi:hypothetical protein
MLWPQIALVPRNYHRSPGASSRQSRSYTPIRRSRIRTSISPCGTSGVCWHPVVLSQRPHPLVVAFAGFAVIALE